MDVVPLTDVDLDRAAELLAKRHARERAAERCLPAVEDYLSQIKRESESEEAAGAAAVHGETVLAYLVGRPDPDGIVRVGLAGCAADQPEALRDVYAFLAADWVAAGWTRHALFVPASTPELIDVWFRLAFGCQFVLAVRETELATPIDFGGVIRPSNPDDLSAAASFDKLLVHLQAGAPRFSGMEPSPLPLELSSDRGVQRNPRRKRMARGGVTTVMDGWDWWWGALMMTMFWAASSP